MKCTPMNKCSIFCRFKLLLKLSWNKKLNMTTVWVQVFLGGFMQPFMSHDGKRDWQLHRPRPAAAMATPTHLCSKDLTFISYVRNVGSPAFRPYLKWFSWNILSESPSHLHISWIPTPSFLAAISLSSGRDTSGHIGWCGYVCGYSSWWSRPPCSQKTTEILYGADAH